ncbi:unnamed protein product [Mytilus edulis]|uniref:C-type lectin domain-containing protein n=1 Tax=Mytilus edulis TaxID=6550 RepID=A0A8S3QMX4_MYTED|nr:unnamed protein product [Mytilus edulis]
MVNYWLDQFLLLTLTYDYLSLVEGEQILNYSPYGVTWNKASSSCGINGLETMEEVLRRSDVLENQQFWIGKSSIFTPWIEMIGIVDCSTETSSRGCVCIQDEVIFNNHKNMSECEESNSYYVYKDFLGTVVDSDNPGNCMTLCCGGCARGSTQSHMFEARNCQAKDFTTVARCEDRTSSYWGATQHKGAMFCESKQQLLLPSTFCHQTGNSKFSGIPAWTNVIREHITECLKTNCTTTPLMCPAGVINALNGNKIFKKSEMACNETLQWFICRSDLQIQPVLYKTTSMSSSGMTPKQLIENQENTETTQVNGITFGITQFEKVTNECHQGFTVTSLIVYKGKVISRSKGHCTTLFCRAGNNNLNAQNCSHGFNDSFAGICGNDGTNQDTLWGKTYDISLLNCMSKNQLLLSPNNYCTNGREYRGIISWTNVFREVYNCHLTKAEAGNRTPLQCLSGHLVKHDGQWKLNKTERECNDQLEWFMCRSFEPPSTITSSSVNVQTKTTKTFERSSVAPSSPGRTSYAMNSTESSGGNKNIGQRNHHVENSEEGSSSKPIGAVIGGLLGACSVITLLAVLIACKFSNLGYMSIGVFKESSTIDKQEPSQMEFSKATYQDSNVTTDNRSTKPTSNETYGLVENSTAVYAVVYKTKTTQNINETYTDAGYGEYDHLHGIQNRRIIQQENMYHSHRSTQNEEDQTYDSSNFSKGKCNDVNSLYDQSCSLVEGEYSYSTNRILDNSNTIGIYDKIS